MTSFNYNYSKVKSPCVSCVKRVIKCHGICNLYKQYKLEMDKLKQTKQKIKAVENDFMGHIAEYHRKRKKRNKC